MITRMLWMTHASLISTTACWMMPLSLLLLECQWQISGGVTKRRLRNGQPRQRRNTLMNRRKTCFAGTIVHTVARTRARRHLPKPPEDRLLHGTCLHKTHVALHRFCVALVQTARRHFASSHSLRRCRCSLLGLILYSLSLSSSFFPLLLFKHYATIHRDCYF